MTASRTDIINLTLAGYSAAEIATRLDISLRTVSRHRVAAGYGAPAAVPLTPEQRTLGDRLVADGVHVAEVARSLGCAHNTVTRNWPHVTRLPKATGAKISALFRMGA